MANDAIANVHAGRLSAGFQRVLRQLSIDAPALRAIEAGEIDAVIDPRRANVILLPAARRALRDSAKRVAAAEHRAALELPRRNSVLAALSGAACRRQLPALKPVMLEAGEVLHETGGPIRHVYFPIDCVICLWTTIDDQHTVATGLVGHEGMVGLPLAFGIGISPVRAEVQVAGTALRMAAASLTHEFNHGLQLRRVLYRYGQDQLNAVRMVAACAVSHRFEQRLAGWLLTLAERAGSTAIFLTQEQLAAVFNVRRVSVTLASGALRARGLIDYQRGRISILDRRELERASCACWRPLAATTPRDD